jgi:hypothetical protein
MTPDDDSEDPIAIVASLWPARPWKPGEAETWRLAARGHSTATWKRALERAQLDRMSDPDSRRRRMCPDLHEVRSALLAVTGGAYGAQERARAPRDAGPPASKTTAEQFLAECRAKLGRTK